jgi:WD40 repeat protein
MSKLLFLLALMSASTAIYSQAPGPIVPKKATANLPKSPNFNFSLVKTLQYEGYQSIGFNYNGSLVVASDYNFETKTDKAVVFNAFSGKNVKTILETAELLGPLAISNTRKTLVATSYNKNEKTFINVYDYASGERIYQYTTKGGYYDVTQLKFSPDDKFLIVGHSEKVYIYNMLNGKEEKVIPYGSSHVSISDDSGLLAFSAYEKDGYNIVLYSLKLFEIINTFKQPSVVNEIVFLPNKNQVAYTSDNYINIINLDDNTLIKQIKFSNEGYLEALAVTTDGLYFAASGAQVNGVIKIFSYQGKMIQSIQAHGGYVDRIIFSKDSNLMISASGGTHYNPIRIWKRNN